MWIRDSFTGASNNDIDNPTLDMGNGLSDINAEAIESMSVLKGASAAALYGLSLIHIWIIPLFQIIRKMFQNFNFVYYPCLLYTSRCV